MDRQRITIRNAKAQTAGVSQTEAQDVPVKQAQKINVNVTDGVTTPATAEKLGLVKIGGGLAITADGTLSVDTADRAEEDNTRPITSAAVYTELGNINALLATI